MNKDIDPIDILEIIRDKKQAALSRYLKYAKNEASFTGEPVEDIMRRDLRSPEDLFVMESPRVYRHRTPDGNLTLERYDNITIVHSPHHEEPVRLTPIEIIYLETLIASPKRIFPASVIDERAYGERNALPDAGTIAEERVRVHIARMRKKLGPNIIYTIKGDGYSLTPPIAVRSEQTLFVAPPPVGK